MMKKLNVLITMFVLILSLFITGCSTETSGGKSGNKNGGSDSTSEKNAETSGYPDRKIDIIVPFAAGGGTDAVGRTLADSLKDVLGVEVIVVNKEGGSGAVGMNEGLNAKADGYTLTMVTREVASLPLLGTAPFKTMDFKYVGNLNIDPAVLVVSSDSEYKTVEDLVDALKKNAGNMTFAASAVPSYYGIQFSDEAGVDFITVPYQGAAPAITELLGGGADFGIYNPGEIKSYVESGQLKTLAVMAEERFSGFPDTPTFKEKGINAVSGTYRGIAVPPDTPDDVVKTLEKAIAEAAKSDKFIDFMNKSFLGIGYKNAEEFKSLVEADIEVLTPVIEIAKKQNN
jgi:tripartite-type tricarboxylate transporter receptor subunit TctC